jgi:hypothetical protein
MTTQYTDNFGFALPDFRQGPWHDLINNDLIKIDSLIFGAMSQANVPPWANATHYNIGTTVIDTVDASVWMCVIAHTSPNAPTTFLQSRTAHPEWWTRLLTGFAPRGEWKQNTNYFPYDLAYDSSRGIMALCQLIHLSTPTGSIVDDKANWAFLLDMSSVGIVIASAVTYANLVSGIPKTNVQDAIDFVEGQIHALDAVNVTQGTDISNIKVKNSDQDARLSSLEGKTSFSGQLTAGHFYASEGGGTQLGGTAQVGFYDDGSNTAIRPHGNGSVYFQSQGGATTYGIFNPNGLSVTGTINSTGNITVPGVVASSLISNGGSITNGGWGGNPNVSVYCLNSQQSHYMYHDGTNVSFAGVGQVSAGNGRLWGDSDHGWPVVNMRMPYAGDWSLPDNTMGEPYGGAVVTGGYVGRFGDYRVSAVALRFRYMQFCTNTWYTVGYA